MCRGLNFPRMTSYRDRSNIFWKLIHWAVQTYPITKMLTWIGRFTAHWKGNYLREITSLLYSTKSRDIIVVWFLSDPNFTLDWENNRYTNNYTFTELVKAIWEQQNENSRCDSRSNTHNIFQKKQPSEGAFFPGRDFDIFAISFLFLEILEWIKKCQNL